MDHRLITPPAAEPVSLSDAKVHLRVDGSAEDVLIAAYLQAAREHVENVTGRALMLQTWELRLDAWSDRIELPRAPLASITSVKYDDTTGAEQSASGYQTVQPSGPTAGCGTVLPPAGGSWPSAGAGAGAIRVRYVAGHATAADVPAALRAAVLLTLGDLYENREASSAVSVSTNPAFHRLIFPYRLWW